MAQISKAYHNLLKRDVTVSEYQQYLTTHPHFGCVKPLSCVECGDAIVFNGGSNRITPHFKHNPSAAGHSYCSLYTEGTESKTPESLTRKKLFREEDISLHFELVYFSGKWKASIVLPPFKNEEIAKNTSNHTKLLIESSWNCNGSKIELPLSNAYLSAGYRKRIELVNFPSYVIIQIKGDSTQRNISYQMDCFKPNEQLYSSTIPENAYVDNPKRKGFSVPPFACKKLGGQIYTGRHYLLFSKESNSPLRDEGLKSAASVIKISGLCDDGLGYYVYDILFNEANDQTKKFCEKRGCELLEKDDISVLWPPITSIGDNKYYRSANTTMFIVSQNGQMVLDMECHSTNYLYFKVGNVNANPFYVSRLKNPIGLKEDVPFEFTEADAFSPIEGYSSYLFRNSTLIGKMNRPTKLKKKQSVLSISNALDRRWISLPQSNGFSVDREEFLDAARYSREFIPLTAINVNDLRERFKTNDLVTDYLDICEKTGSIKFHVVKILLGE